MCAKSAIEPPQSQIGLVEQGAQIGRHWRNGDCWESH